MKISRRIRPNMCRTWVGVQKRPTTRTSAMKQGCEVDSKTKKKPKNAAKRTKKKD